MYNPRLLPYRSQAIVDVETAVLSVFKISYTDFETHMHVRRGEYRDARYYTWLVLRSMTTYSYKRLAKIYPKDRVTIMHGVNVLLDDIDRNRAKRALFMHIVDLLRDKGYSLPDGWEHMVRKRNIYGL